MKKKVPIYGPTAHIDRYECCSPFQWTLFIFSFSFFYSIKLFVNGDLRVVGREVGGVCVWVEIFDFLKIFWNEKLWLSCIVIGTFCLNWMIVAKGGDYLLSFSCRAMCVCVCVRFSKAQFNTRGFPFWVEKYREKKTTKISMKRLGQLCLS